jgi:hypothetical protein
LNPSAITSAKKYFTTLLNQEKKLFFQHAEFIQNPKACLLASLMAIEGDPKIQQEYKTHLFPLIYGKHKPTFQEAFQDFKYCASALIGELTNV